MTLPAPFVGPTDIRMQVILQAWVEMDKVLSVLARTLGGFPEINAISWAIDRDAGDTPGSIADLRAALKRRPDASTLVLNLDARGLNWILIKRHGQGLPTDAGIPENCLTVDCDSGADLDEAEVRQALTVQSTILRAFCDGPDIMGAELLRNASCYVPRPPEGHAFYPMKIVSRRAVEDSYADPQVYWRNWDSCDDLGGDRVLLTRALDVLDERAYKRAVYPRIWELLYAARPGKSSHFDVADLWPEDMAHFEEGEPYLRQEGYSATEQSLEFTAVVPAGEHLRPREIMVLARYRSDGRLPSGEPLQRVKVTFVDLEMARREKRPLMDAGIEVWCYAPDATLVQVLD